MDVNAVGTQGVSAAEAKTREAFDSSIGEMFFKQLLGAMRQTQGKPAYFHGGQAEEMFKGQLDQTIAQQMTKTHARRQQQQTACTQDSLVLNHLVTRSPCHPLAPSFLSSGNLRMTMHHDWEANLAGFLNELSAVQAELLDLLAAKRSRLAAADLSGLAALAEREQVLTSRLQACQDRRAELLRLAQAQGLPGDSLQSLHAALPARQAAVEANVRQAAARTRLLQQESLSNWVLTQRTLLYLSQLLELIGTGGRTRPTYSKGEPASARGALMDRAA